MSAEAETAILDKAWRAIDALGGTHEPGEEDYGHGYDDALNFAIAEIEKLGGMDPAQRQRKPPFHSLSECAGCGATGDDFGSVNVEAFEVTGELYCEDCADEAIALTQQDAA